MSALFNAIDSLFTKQDVDTVPSSFMLHRFLSADSRYASVAAELATTCKDDEMIYRIWKDGLPQRKKAPWFGYVAPKKKATEKFLNHYANIHKLKKSVAEEELDLLDGCGGLSVIKEEMGWEDD